jgi:integrase
MLQKFEITNKSIALAPAGRHHAGTKGLYLWVSPDGQVRRWLYRYTSPVTHRVTETGFGPVTVLTLAQAKKKANDYERMIAQDICPIHAKRAERASQTTFKQACDGWIATHQSAWKNGHGGSQMRNAKLCLFTHGKPLLDKPVAQITPDMVEAALKSLWKRTPLQGRRALEMFARVLDYAKAKGMRTGDNPADWKGMHQYRFARVRKEAHGHYAAMPYEGIPAFMQELRQRQGRSTGATCLEFTILTVCRTQEALGAQWSEINWDEKLWTIPAARMKTGDTHEVPLTERVMELLALQKQYSNGSEFIFMGNCRIRVENRVMRSVLQRMGVNVTVHGFRSSFRDWCGDETNFPRERVEACLAHRVGNSVELAYRRLTALEKRREILEAWSRFCCQHTDL